ncbi:hypothetical protein [Anaeromyxobacter dehalogenans]|uniref:Uncharacterized protein n=1 Tax=Anaeromyxobacter dehalogenans (strain 2CP-C) TaxID=290397 RepID=Q2IEB4_ANADE|nr:hypothetical protein [Anaeromyxobacter dehalogenans]ABC82926.1 hypothetical protein Adeh_3157 [Anaeromyxobacter dehalogenans 2CP-C]
MRTRTFLAVAAATLFAGSALAADLPPSAGSYDDVNYGETTHTTLTTSGTGGAGAVAAGPGYDDTRYPSQAPARERVVRPEAARMACACTR